MEGIEGRPGDRVAERAEPATGRGPRRRPVSAQRADEEKFEEPVKYRLLAGLSAADSFGQPGEQRAERTIARARRAPGSATTAPRQRPDSDACFNLPDCWDGIAFC
jgi:hypothetical protein